MAITGGMAYIVLFAVIQSIWLVTNCHQEKEPTGIIQVSGSDQKINMIPLEQPTKEASPEELIKALEWPNRFSVLKMKEQLRTGIDSLISLPDFEFRNGFAKIIQKAFYKDIRKKHSDWIVIPVGIERFLSHQYVEQAHIDIVAPSHPYDENAHIDNLFSSHPNDEIAHIDILRDANVFSLLTQYEGWSIDFMEFLGKNKKVKSAALHYYNGNVEQYAIEMLTLAHTMNIWIPLEPIESWPLAFTPADQCGESRTINSHTRYGGVQPLQYLFRSEFAVNDWYTRWNMQPDEVYVWDSRTVAHAAVNIGDGKGKRSSVACRLLIVHPKVARTTWNLWRLNFNTLCYTQRLFQEIMSRHRCEPEHAKRILAEMGYDRSCDLSPKKAWNTLLSWQTIWHGFGFQ